MFVVLLGYEGGFNAWIIIPVRCVQQEVEKEIQRQFVERVPLVGRAKVLALSSTGPSSSSLSSSGKSPPLPKTAAETFPSLYHEWEFSRQVSSQILLTCFSRSLNQVP